MPKVLFMNCACTGSTGKIIGDIADYAVLKGYENILCAPCAPGSNKNIKYYRTSLPKEQGIYRRLNYLYGFQYGLAPLSTARIKRIICKEKPDIIHIHCINGFMVDIYSLIGYIKKHHIPTVITNHAEFFYTGSCALAYECEQWMTGCKNCPREKQSTGGKIWKTAAAGWKRMEKAFSNWDRVIMVSVSPWVGKRAAMAPIVKSIPQAVVTNGVNTQVFTYRDPAALRRKYGFSPATKIIFHPTASFSDSEADRKGGRFVIELAKRFAGEDVVVLVAGRYADRLQLPDNMTMLGMLSDQKRLAEYYAMADVTVVAGKQETFNMPVAESLCCGTPVVGFLAGGPESIAIKKYSYFSEHGNVDLLENNLRKLLVSNLDAEMISNEAQQYYAASTMAEQYIGLYDRVLTGVNES